MIKRLIRILGVVVALGVGVYLEPLLAVLVGLTVVNLLVREHFPFSHFPMYSGFGETSFYLYLANENDEPVPVQHFRLSSTSLKKIYRTQVRSEYPDETIEDLPVEALQRAGRYALAYLRQRPIRKKLPATYTTLRLYQVTLAVDGNGIRKEAVLVAEG